MRQGSTVSGYRRLNMRQGSTVSGYWRLNMRQVSTVSGYWRLNMRQGSTVSGYWRLNIAPTPKKKCWPRSAIIQFVISQYSNPSLSIAKRTKDSVFLFSRITLPSSVFMHFFPLQFVTCTFCRQGVTSG